MKYHFLFFLHVYGEISLQLIREFRRDFLRNLQLSIGMLKVIKGNSNVRFKFANSGHAWSSVTVRPFNSIANATNPYELQEKE